MKGKGGQSMWKRGRIKERLERGERGRKKLENIEEERIGKK